MVKEYKIKFESKAAEDFTDYGIEYAKDKDGNIVTKNVLDKPFIIKKGQTKTVDEKTFKYLEKKGSVKTLAEQAEVARLKTKLLNRKSKRQEPKKDTQYLTDEEISTVLNDIPFEVEE